MIKLAIIGGFLGAGKTTLIAKLAKYYESIGLRIGIVTNDQGSELVDTAFLKSEGFSVVEVEGGCFCCNFDLFTEKIEDLAEVNRPHIILAEPVGSCTDLMATIFKPLLGEDVFIEKYAQHFSYAPLTVVIDPKRMKKLMLEQEKNYFPNEINYLFKKQLEEANMILLNKIDLLPQAEAQAMMQYISEHYKGATIMPISAKEGDQVEVFGRLLLEKEILEAKSLEIDYPTYGAAEAYLGWLNASGYISSPHPIDTSKWVETLLKQYKKAFKNEQEEIAHLKVYAVGQEDFLKASLVGIEEDIDFNKEMEQPIDTFNFILNARVNVHPAKLKEIIEGILRETLSQYEAELTHFKVESFVPGYPTPKYRMA